MDPRMSVATSKFALRSSNASSAECLPLQTDYVARPLEDLPGFAGPRFGFVEVDLF
jgi:hypothetical protein